MLRYIVRFTVEMEAKSLQPNKNLSVVLAACSLVVLLLLAGCRDSQTGSVGGTKGFLRAGDRLALADVQVNVYQLGGDKPRLVGMGVSNVEGCFELYRSEDSEPLWLQPAEYAFTIESVGPVPLTWKEPVHAVDKTPLRKKWTETDSTLNLSVPAPHVRKP